MTPKKHICYIAGPMTGFPSYNFPAFDAARDMLAEQGHHVMSPADLDRENGFDAIKTPDKVVTEEFVRAARKRDIEAIEMCDAIYMLKGWEDSVGARAELAYAMWCGHTVIWQTPPEWATTSEVDTPAESILQESIGTAPEESVLQEAIRITSGTRRRDYDKATPNHERIAGAWNWYLGARKNPVAEISALDVSTMMILLKVARACHTPTRDSFVDMAGYAKCCSQIAGFEAE